MAIAETASMVLTGAPVGVDAAIARERLEKLADELFGADVVEAPRYLEVYVVIVD